MKEGGSSNSGIGLGPTAISHIDGWLHQVDKL